MTSKITHLSIPKKRVTRIVKHYDQDKHTIWTQGNTEFYYIIKNNPIYYYKKGRKIHKILDVNSFGNTYFKIGNVCLSPNQKYLLFSADRVGDGVFYLYIKPLFGKTIQKIKEPMNGDFVWIDNQCIIFPNINEGYNTDKTYVYDVIQKKRTLLYENKDTFIHLYNINDIVFLYDSSYDSDEVYKIEHDLTMNKLFNKSKDVYYPYIEHDDDLWYIHEANRGKNIIKTTRDFKTFLIVYKNDDVYTTLKNIVVQHHKVYFILCKGGEKTCVHGPSRLYIDDKYKVTMDEKLNVYVESYLTPKHNIKFCLRESPYIEKTIHIKPMLSFTMMYKKKHILNQSKCLVYGYGSYGQDTMKYSPFLFELLDAGFIVVMAHIRGDGYFGFKGYDQGRMLHKKNTFKDFVDIIFYLFEKKYTNKESLTIWGRSAGGLLIASVLNQYDICHLAILGVPFVMPLLNVSCPMYPYGHASRREFGNIEYKTHYQYLKSYDPYYNIDLNHNYPHIFIYTNQYDRVVPTIEPITYYEKLKHVNVFKTKEKTLTLFVDQKYGHGQGSSRKQKEGSNAQIIDLIIKLNVKT